MGVIATTYKDYPGKPGSSSGPSTASSSSAASGSNVSDGASAMRVKPACQEVRDELLQCLIRTDCVLRSGKTPSECIKSPGELPLQCQHLITAFADCKKGMLDMRRRFRGNHLSTRDAKADPADARLGVVEITPERGAR